MASRTAKPRFSPYSRRGHTYREVADELFISPATVKSHVAHLFDKTGARNKVELINLTQ